MSKIGCLVTLVVLDADGVIELQFPAQGRSPHKTQSIILLMMISVKSLVSKQLVFALVGVLPASAAVTLGHVVKALVFSYDIW